ncbi:MAG: metallophosphoesterase family protein [Polyangiales bacterium]
MSPRWPAWLASVVLVSAVACGGAVPEARAPITAPPPSLKIFVGGDSRGDESHVFPWSLQLAKEHGVRAFFFLGDMEAKPDQQAHFVAELDAADAGAFPFFPLPGNHDVAKRDLGKDADPTKRADAEAHFRAAFLGVPRTPAKSAFDDKIVYSVDVESIHFVALDNVSQPGFGADQLAWLARDLHEAVTRAKHVLVGMHKPLAKNGFTTHSMDEDGVAAVADSDAALSLIQAAHVEAIFVSHFHGYAKLSTGGIPTYVTGGLGAPLDDKHGADVAIHHVLELERVADDQPLRVTVLKFPGAAHFGAEHGE